MNCKTHFQWLLVIVMLMTVFTGTSQALDNTIKNLIERSAIVVLGRVERVNASIEPLQAASASTCVVKFLHLYAGSEIAGNQTDKYATVIITKPGKLKVGMEALFFGNRRFLGKSLTLIDEGEILPEALNETDYMILAQAQRLRLDKVIIGRLSIASQVFRGKVESERSLSEALSTSGQNTESRMPDNEHDPEWHIAKVQVFKSMQNAREGATINVIFPASKDIMWFNSPKLKANEDAIFIIHKPSQLIGFPQINAFLKEPTTQIVTHPLDVLPASDEAHIRELLKKERQ